MSAGENRVEGYIVRSLDDSTRYGNSGVNSMLPAMTETAAMILAAELNARFGKLFEASRVPNQYDVRYVQDERGKVFTNDGGGSRKVERG